MNNKDLLFILWIFHAFTLSAWADDANDPVIIWSEDFTGWYEARKGNKNAIYDISSSPGIVSFTDNSKGKEKPELSLGQTDHFEATVFLYGASDTLNLSFKGNNFKYIFVYLNGSKKHLTIDSKKGCRFPAYGKKYITLRFEGGKSTAKIDDILLTASPGCRKKKHDAKLNYNCLQDSVYLDEESYYQNLDNPNNLEVHYWSSDPSVAEVTENGNVNLNSVGETTIYAIYYGGTGTCKDFVEDSVYSYQEVSYKLKIKRRKPKDEIFYESFNQNLSFGGYKNHLKRSNGIGDLKYDNKLNAKCIGNYSAYKCIYLEKEVRPYRQAKYAFRPTGSINGKECTLSFKYVKSNQKYTEDSIIVYYRKKGAKSDTQVKLKPLQSEWTEIKLKLGTIEEDSAIAIAGNEFYLDEVSLIGKEIIKNVKIHISKYGYATLYYSDRALIVPGGITAYTLKADYDENKLVPSVVYNSFDIIPKGEPVLLKAYPGDYIMYLSDENINKDNNNDLRGTDNYELTTGGDVYYLFGADTLKTENNIGFYWGADDGKAFINSSHKAYLPVKLINNGKKTQCFPLALNNNQTTEINRIKSTTNNHSIKDYSLSGIPVHTNFHGVIIRNGKKFIKR